MKQTLNRFLQAGTGLCAAAWRGLALLALALSLAIGFASQAHAQVTNPIFYSQSFAVGANGQPTTYTISLPRPTNIGAPFFVSAIRTQPPGTLSATAAAVTLNGTPVIRSTDFSALVFAVTREVQLLPQNTVRFTVSGRAGARATLAFFGTPLLPGPVSLTPDPLTLVPGATGTLTGTLSPAPLFASTVTLSSSVPGVATVPASVNVAAGQTSFQVLVTAVASGNATVAARLNGRSASAVVQVRAPAPTVASIVPANTSVTEGGAVQLTVNLSAAAPADTPVALSAAPAGIITLPASVTVPAGQTAATFAVQALAPGQANVTATANGSSASSLVTVTPRPPIVTSIQPAAATLTLGSTTNLTVTVSAAQTASVTVDLAATPTGVVSVPANATIPAGQTSATFTVAAAALGNATVRASLNGSFAQAAVQVAAPPAEIVSLEPQLLGLTVGATGSFTLGINAAQSLPVTATITAQHPTILQVPATVTVPAGATSVAFTVTGLAEGDTMVTATVGNTSRSAGITVGPPPAAIASLIPDPLPLQQGATGAMTVSINAAQRTDTQIALSVADPALAQAPVSVIVRAGQTSAPFNVTALAAGSTTITASVGASSVTSRIDITPPPPQVTRLEPLDLPLAKGAVGTLRVTVSRAPSEPLAVTLASSVPAVADVPPSVTVAAGALGADVPVRSLVQGSTVVTASANGGSASATVTVTAPAVVSMTLAPQNPSIFPGQTQEFTAQGTLTDGTQADLTTSATWTSSAQQVASVASTGVATGLAPGTATITASQGTASASSTLTVLAQPTLALLPANTTVNVGEAFSLQVVASAPAGPAGLPVNLSPAGTATLNLPGAVTIPAGQTSTVLNLTAGSEGTATLTASANGFAVASANIVVTAPRLAVSAVTPASAGVGSQITLTGTGFDPVASQNTVTFTGGAAAEVVSVGATQLVVRVPAGAQSGPITVANSRGTTQSPSFTVVRQQDFNLAASPAELVIPAGASTTASLQMGSLGLDAFTGLVTLRASGMPAGVSVKFEPPTLTGGQVGTIRFTVADTAAPGSYAITITGTGLVSGVQQSRSGTLDLRIVSGVNVTGLKGRFITPDGQGVAGVIVRADIPAQPQTVTDAAGNFLLADLPIGAVTLRFDATPANPLYPIWPYVATVVAGKMTVIPDWTIHPPPAADKFTPIANAAADQIVTDPRFPGVEVKLPAGVTIIGYDGVPKSRIAIEKREADQLGVTPPPAAVGSAYQLYFGTPMGGIPSAPIPISLPNDVAAEPGEALDVWYFDGSPMGGAGEWKIAGKATVSADGKLARMADGTGIPRFCGVCGLTCLGKPPKGDDPGKGCPQGTGGNPVNLYSGQEQASATGLRCGGLVPIDTGTSYTAIDAFNNIGGTTGSVGFGWVLDYDIMWLAFDGPQKRLVLPPNVAVNFTDDGSGTYRNVDDPRFDGATVRAAGPGWELTHKDGKRWRFEPFPGNVGRLRGAPPMFLTAIVEPAGATLSITRNSVGHLLAAGTQNRSISATYGPNGFIAELKDPENRTTRFTYTAANRIETLTDSEGGITRYTYVADNALGADAACSFALPVDQGQRIKTIAYPGRPTPTENFYGPGRRVIRQLAYDGRETRFAYKLVGGCVTNVASPGTICSGPACPDIDSWENWQAGWRIHGGRVVSTTVTEPDGTERTTRYGAAGQMLDQGDRQGQVTKYTRDAGYRITAQTDALGRSTRYQYDDKGNVIRAIDAAGRITDTTYDTKWNKIASVTRTLEDGTPVINQFAYDPVTGNLIRTIDPLGNTTTYAYTPRGQLEKVTDPLGHITTYAYNLAGDLVSVTDPLGNEASLATDRAGRPVAATDPRGFTTQIQYDGLDRITQTTDPLGGITRNTFDAAQRPAAVIDALGHVVESYTWDAGDRLTATTDALLGASAFTYDANKRLASVTDRKGQTTRYERDAGGRITAIDHADGNRETRSFDAAGRLIQVQDTAATIAYTYDLLDRVSRETVTTAAGSHTVDYRYDNLDRRIERRVDGADPAAYAYDRAGRLTAITYRNQVTGYEWDGAGRLTKKTLPNGISQNFAYDAASRLLILAYRKPDGTPIEEVAYTYDAAGNRLSKSTASPTVQETAFSAAYDSANRMNSITLNPDTAQQKFYLLTYDANGNLVSKTNQGDPADTSAYTWDARNRLVAISAPGIDAAFKYDSLGRRIERTVNGETTRYVYDGVQAIGELRPGADAALLTGLGIDEAIARYTAAGARSYLTDALGSVLAQVREDATTVNRYGYSPYGEAKSTSADEGNATQYTARENDGTGLYFYRARYYDPVLKRFIAEDPIGLAGGINLYTYVTGNPASRSDPTGLLAPAVAACFANPACVALAAATAIAVANAIVGTLDAISGSNGSGATADGDSISGSSPGSTSDKPGQVCKPAIPDVEPGDLCEQLALAEAKAGAGAPIMSGLGDEPRLVAWYGPGPWVKMQHKHRCPDGRLLVIHYFTNGRGLNVELKFV